MIVEITAISSKTVLVSTLAKADKAAAIVIAQPLNRKEFVAIRLIAAWMNSRCFSLHSILMAYARSFLRLSQFQLYVTPASITAQSREPSRYPMIWNRGFPRLLAMAISFLTPGALRVLGPSITMNLSA